MAYVARLLSWEGYIVEKSSCKSRPDIAMLGIQGRDYGRGGGEARGGVEETWYYAFVYRRYACLRDLWATWSALKGIWWPPQPAEKVGECDRVEKDGLKWEETRFPEEPLTGKGEGALRD
jgi:hypothetical protein